MGLIRRPLSLKNEDGSEGGRSHDLFTDEDGRESKKGAREIDAGAPVPERLLKKMKERKNEGLWPEKTRPSGRLVSSFACCMLVY